jgi:hypothetical protein
MITKREFSEGVLDRRLVGVTRNAENFVVVPLGSWNGASPAFKVIKAKRIGQRAWTKDLSGGS